MPRAYSEPNWHNHLRTPKIDQDLASSHSSPHQRKGGQKQQPLPSRHRLLLGETSKNLTKVDTNINVNTTVLPHMGTIVCPNISLLCRVFSYAQSIDTSAHDTHPIPFLYSAAVQLGSKITSWLLQDAVYSDTEQTILLLYTALSCLDTIVTNIGKEASNPNMIQQAHQESRDQAPSKQFTSANCALIACLNQLDLIAIVGAFLPHTMLYKVSNAMMTNSLQQPSNSKLHHTTCPTMFNHTGKAPQPTTLQDFQTTNPPIDHPHCKPTADMEHKETTLTTLKILSTLQLLMPEGHSRQFCMGFLRNGPTCQLNPCPTPHICINDLPQADQQLWINHMQCTINTSFNTAKKKVLIHVP